MILSDLKYLLWIIYPVDWFTFKTKKSSSEVEQILKKSILNPQPFGLSWKKKNYVIGSSYSYYGKYCNNKFKITDIRIPFSLDPPIIRGKIQAQERDTLIHIKMSYSKLIQCGYWYLLIKLSLFTYYYFFLFNTPQLNNGVSGLRWLFPLLITVFFWFFHYTFFIRIQKTKLNFMHLLDAKLVDTN